MRKSRFLQKFAGVAAAVTMGMGMLMFTAAPASAGDRDSVCEGGEVCLYYLTDLNGGAWTINDSFVNWFSDEIFYGGGAGTGSSIDNNTWSGRNRASFCDVTLSTGTWQTGSHVEIDNGAQLNDFNEYRDTFSSYIFC